VDTLTPTLGKVKVYALVRDKNGKPKIDDPENIPAEIWDALTDDEKLEIENGCNTPRSNT
jgi:hypothetical protein